METGEENRGGKGSPPGAEGDQRRPAPIYTQGFFERWMKMARAKKMATVTNEGNRLQQLENLSIFLAKQIDICAKDAVN